MLEFGGSRLGFNVSFVELNMDVKAIIYEDDIVEVHSFPLVHKIPTCGFFIKEKPKPLKINPKKIKEYNLKIEQFKSLQNGKDIVLESGEKCKYQELTLPSKEVLSYAYCSDTKKSLTISKYVKSATVLYHEATFLIKDQKRANATTHSSTKDAADIAIAAEVKKLVVGHISSRYKTNEEHISELKELFINSDVVEDGMCIDLTKV